MFTLFLICFCFVVSIRVVRKHNGRIVAPNYYLLGFYVRNWFHLFIKLMFSAMFATYTCC